MKDTFFFLQNLYGVQVCISTPCGLFAQGKHKHFLRPQHLSISNLSISHPCPPSEGLKNQLHADYFPWLPEKSFLVPFLPSSSFLPLGNMLPCRDVSEWICKKTISRPYVITNLWPRTCSSSQEVNLLLVSQTCQKSLPLMMIQEAKQWRL